MSNVRAWYVLIGGRENYSILRTAGERTRRPSCSASRVPTFVNVSPSSSRATTWSIVSPTVPVSATPATSARFGCRDIRPSTLKPVHYPRQPAQRTSSLNSRPKQGFYDANSTKVAPIDDVNVIESGDESSIGTQACSSVCSSARSSRWRLLPLSCPYTIDYLPSPIGSDPIFV
jgi:hypothetical protein